MEITKYLFAGFLFFICTALHAAPITYRFDGITNFISNPMDAVLTVDVTVDNGNTSTVNQRYFNDQVTGIAITDGNAFDSINVADNFSLTSGSVAYISTNNLGVPTLDLRTDIAATRVRFATDPLAIQSCCPSGSTIFQLGTSRNGNGFISVFAFLDDTFYQRLGPLTTTGVNLSPVQVPEPSALLLMSIGLLGLTYTRRRKTLL